MSDVEIYKGQGLRQETAQAPLGVDATPPPPIEPGVIGQEMHLSLSDIAWRTRGIAGVTNDVGFSVVTEGEHKGTPVVVKVGTPSVEPREIMEEIGGHVVGGWLAHRLENEEKLIALLQSHDVPVSRLIGYHRMEDASAKEIIVEERIPGETCYVLRPSNSPDVSEEEFMEMERQKGGILAKIQAIPATERQFGPLDPESMQFPSWREYFNYKVTTTLSLAYRSYDQLKKLQRFSSLAISEAEWQQKLEHIATLYSSRTVQDLLEKDGISTVTHGDYWDANLMGEKGDDNQWTIRVIDLERGDISGRSFDMSLNLGWKIGGSDQDPMEKSAAFLEGFKAAGGTVPEDMRKYIAMYNLWQYLDFCLIDDIYSIDRTDESVGEIHKYIRQLEEFVQDDSEK